MFTQRYAGQKLRMRCPHLISCLTAVNTAQILTNHMLNNFCLGKPVRAKTWHLYLYQSQVTTVFTLEEELETQFLFRSEDT